MDRPARPVPTQDCAIIVPSYGRPEKARACAETLMGLDGGKWPIIVVDDGSPTPLAPLLADLAPQVRVVRRENGGPGAARNTGAEAADGARLLLFTDDDCRPRPDWALRLVAAQNDRPMQLVGGRIVNGLERDVYAAASQSLSTYLYAFYQARQSPMDFFTTNNMCLRRADFLALGGFDESFRIASEDRDFSLRWKDAGGVLDYAHEAVVDHFHDMTLPAFWRQHAGYGRGARRLHLALDERGDDRPKVERLSFYLGLLAYPLTRPGRWRLIQSFLMGLSQVAMVAGYAAALRAEKRDGDRL